LPAGVIAYKMGVMHGPGVTPDFDRTTGSLLLRLRKAAVGLGERPVLYSRLEAITGLAIPPRPAHVTLYTWGDHGGIGIATWEEFDERVAGAVDPAELDTEVP
jgi:hypothetical protein